MTPTRPLPRWPLLLIAAPAAVAIWSGWVGLGGMAGFGVVRPLPGIASAVQVNTAITLPIGVEAYGAFALGAWLLPGTGPKARRFARWSAIGALALGCLGQITYHLLAAAHVTVAPWPIVIAVSCLPIVTLGFGMALVHLLRADDTDTAAVPVAVPVVMPPLPVATLTPPEAVTQTPAESPPVATAETTPQRQPARQTTRQKAASDRRQETRQSSPAYRRRLRHHSRSNCRPSVASQTHRPAVEGGDDSAAPRHQQGEAHA